MTILAGLELQPEWESNRFPKASFLSLQEVKSFLLEINELLSADDSSPRPSLTNRHSCRIFFLGFNVKHSARIFNLVGNCLAEGVRYCYLGHCTLDASLIVQSPRFCLFEVHQDCGFVAEQDVRYMTFCRPLADTDIADASSYIDAFRDSLVRGWLQPDPIKAGNALFWDSPMIQWSADSYAKGLGVGIRVFRIPLHSQPVVNFHGKERSDPYELHEVDRDFWLITDRRQLFSCQSCANSVENLPNQNRRIAGVEFCELLQARTG